MKSAILHILNGDATAGIFREAQLGGRVMIWREALIQGPVYHALDSDLFWDMRAQFLEKALNVKLARYRREVVREFKKIADFSGRELVLWFEFDLFCQINMAAVLSYLLKNKPGYKVSLVEIGKVPGHTEKKSFGEISSKAYPTLFRNRRVIGQEHMLMADKIWMMFCNSQFNELQQIDSLPFQYMESALKQFSLFEKQANGLSGIQNHILTLIHENPQDPHLLIRRLIAENRDLGFGDSQYKFLIKELGKYIRLNDGVLSLSEMGERLYIS